MFHTARIKLTLWYLLISMTISLSFSGIIYRVLTQEVDRFSRRLSIQQRLQEGAIFGQAPPFIATLPAPDPAIIWEINHRILFALFIINGSIFMISGLLGYFLAGRTLSPIQEMVDEQHRFISDASHEFRTPLTALKSAMEVALRDKNLSLSDAKKTLEDNIADVNKLQSLSDGLLQLAQYQKPNGNASFTKISVGTTINAALKEVAFAAQGKNIIIQTRYKPMTMVGNAYGITDLLVILLDNAIKYSPKNTTIRITAQKSDGSIELVVKDQGNGIAAKDLPHIFDRFYRADTARSKPFAGGYGLGLSIAKKICDVHHGKISVKSSPHHGSTFTINLPIKQTG